MTEKTLVSIRLDKEVVESFDRLAYNHRGWSRSSLINEVLQFVIHAATTWEIMRMAKTWPKDKAKFQDFIHES